jgi:hypothetical protein
MQFRNYYDIQTYITVPVPVRYTVYSLVCNGTTNNEALKGTFSRGKVDKAKAIRYLH